MAPVGAAAAARQADPVLTRIVDQDQVPWYRKRNLRRLYMLLLPTCIGIEMTSGFDSQMINTVQISPQWQACKEQRVWKSGLQLTRTDFNTPKGALLGIISAAYNLGAVFALPLVPYINDRFGRRWSIFLGSWIMVVASLIQALSVSGTSNARFTVRALLTIFSSRHVRCSTTFTGLWYSFLYHCRLVVDG
jgi:MFS family permease